MPLYYKCSSKRSNLQSQTCCDDFSLIANLIESHHGSYVVFYYCDKHKNQKPLREEKCGFHVPGHSLSYRGVKTGAEAETKEAHCLLCAPSYLSYKAQAHLPRDGSAHSRLGYPTLIGNPI